MKQDFSFKDLIVWQKSMELSKNVYLICQRLPKDELYGLSSQIKRSVVSIPSNIAEGNKRGTTKEYRQFLKIASGSAAELETQLLLLESIYNVDCQKEISLLNEVQKILTVIIRKLNSD